MASKIRPYEYYYERYQLGISYTENVDYGDRQSVRRNNRGTDMYRKAAQNIGQYYPDRIADFADDLNNSDKKRRTVCAVCLIELMQPDQEMRRRALDVIKDLAENGDQFEQHVWSIWLREHSKRFE